MHYRIPKPPHGSTEWLAARWANSNGEKLVSASVAAAVHGQHPFVTMGDLAIELLKDTPPEPKEQNAAMLRGTTLEAPIREWASTLIGKTLVEPNELYGFDDGNGARLIATIDSMSPEGNVFEQKTSNKIWRGKLPDYWYWQGVHQAICCDVPDITWVIFDSTLDLHFFVQKVTSDEKQLHLEAVRRFLAAIDMHMIPNEAELSYENVARLHTEGLGGIDEAVEIPPATRDLLNTYADLKKQSADIERRLDVIKADVCLLLGDSQYGLINDELAVQWTNTTRKSFDSKAFEKDHPALFEKYKKETKFRTFRVVKEK